MVLFCLKSYNIVALYENKDDEYASKIGKSAVAFIPEVTISESEIAELEKPKFKEVKPKDVEVEKPDNRGLSRLDQAVGMDKADEILKARYKSVLVTIDKTGDVKTYILDANGKMIK